MSLLFPIAFGGTWGDPDGADREVTGVVLTLMETRTYGCEFACGHRRQVMAYRPLLLGEKLWCPVCDRPRAIVRLSYADLSVTYDWT
jgi:hypothetical protein